jgi:glycosyltransferase involved in cell wall biosynthesis
MPHEPQLSVVVATYNRAQTLHETLRHLQAQTLPATDFEVIVVDDGSPDDTAATVQQFQAEARFPLQYLRHPNRGPGYTQNRGVRIARAPVLLLIADDIFLAPGALAAHLAVHARPSPRPVAVLGRVLQSPALTQSVFLAKWDPWHLGNLPDGQVLPYYMFWACNISIRRDVMLAHGMFRDEMGRGGAAAHEDVELGYRLHQQGLQVVYSRDAWGHHHHVETLEGTLRRSHQRGLNWPDFRRRVPHPEIDVSYRAYDLSTLLAQWQALRGPRRPYLMGADRSLLWLGLRHLQRRLMFNRLSVRALWLPLFAAAEVHPWVARLVHENMYRGVVVHYFQRGRADAGRQPGTGTASRAAGGAG